MKKSFSISTRSVFLFVVVLGFLFPRGYIEVSEVYHKVCSAIMWLAVLLTWLQWMKCSKRKNNLFFWKIKKYVLQIGAYFILAIIITIRNHFFFIPTILLIIISVYHIFSINSICFYYNYIPKKIIFHLLLFH